MRPLLVRGGDLAAYIESLRPARSPGAVRKSLRSALRAMLDDVDRMDAKFPTRALAAVNRSQDRESRLRPLFAEMQRSVVRHAARRR